MTAALAALAGVLAGAVLKYFFDQRGSRRNKLLDEKLKYAVAFLAAADWAARSYQIQERASDDLVDDDVEKTDRDIVDLEHDRDYARQQADVALKEAHTAASALRLLMPELGGTPGDYMQLSVSHSVYDAVGQRERERARAALEARLVSAFKTAPSRPWSRWRG